MFRITTMMFLFGFSAALEAPSFAQVSIDPNGASNPYRLDADWLKFPMRPYTRSFSLTVSMRPSAFFQASRPPSMWQAGRPASWAARTAIAERSPNAQ
jgi:hypothetical protein